MGTKRFNVKGEAFQERVKLFQETMKKIDKQAIIDGFKLGLEVGYFVYKDKKSGQVKRMHPNNDLFYQFNDGKFVYTLLRMPIINMKQPSNSPIAYAILDKDRGGRKF